MYLLIRSFVRWFRDRQQRATGDDHGGVILPTIAFLTLILWYCHFYRGEILRSKEQNSTGGEKHKLSTVSYCSNPNCVRCQRYRYVQQQAKRKLSYILRDSKTRNPSTVSALNRRIPEAILGSGGEKNEPSTMQNPTVLMVSDLPSKEIVTSWHRDACNYLQEHKTRVIVSEALGSLSHGKISGADDAEPSSHQSSQLPSDDSEWIWNDSSGEWRVFQILNQGVWNPVLLQQDYGHPCRDLLELVRGIPGLLEASLFGNAFVSKIYPGTIIEPHCGPTNIRHRLQFLLKLPQDYANDDANQTPRLSLSVGRQKNIVWDMTNDTFVFDDSFIHSVSYREKESRDVESEDLRNKGSLARIVLIVDLWHPALHDQEIKLLKDLYPPYSSS